MLVLAAVLSTMHFEGDVSAAGGDYAAVAFDVPAGTVEIQVHHDDGSDSVILDWGAWTPSGFRGWGGGLTDDAVIGIAQSSRSYLPGAIDAGSWTVMIGKAQLATDGTGHYSIDVTCRDDATLPLRPMAPFAPVVVDSTRRWYKGDFHVHSTESGDAHASIDQVIALARSRGLDFINLSDHNTISQHALIAAIQPSLTDLLVLRGAEVTTYAGHGGAVGIHDYVDHRVGFGGRTIKNVIDDVVAQGGVFIVNHPALDLGTLCIGCAWKHDDTPWDEVSGIEVITGNYDLVERAFTPQVITMWDGLLDQGFRIAAIGGSDDHDAGTGTGPDASPIGSPTTLVLADSLSEAAIVDAVKHGRTIVQFRGPDDPLVEFTMKTQAGAEGEIGDELDDLDHVAITIHVTQGDGTFAQVWRDGVKLNQLAVSGDDATLHYDEAPGAADHRYRIELIDDANHRVVVTSHIYVHGIAAPAGCGCGTTSTDGAIPLLLVMFGLSRSRAGSRKARR
jgi:hypothetical protein